MIYMIYIYIFLFLFLIYVGDFFDLLNVSTILVNWHPGLCKSRGRKFIFAMLAEYLEFVALLFSSCTEIAIF